ncbi:MAG: hypothetical protein ACHRXM_18805 [Isosphaerales bacterium]
MNTRSSWVQGSLLVALVIGLLAVPEAGAKGSRGGRSGGQGARAPRVSAARGAYRAPRMPRAAAPARANYARTRTRANSAHTHASAAQTNTGAAQTNTGAAQTNTGAAQTYSHAAQARANRAAVAAATGRATTGTVNTATTAIGNTTPTTLTTPSNLSPSTYTYGSGTGARHYRAYGYGRGYNNRYYGGRYGYGRSQGNNRAIVARLQSVHASLARIDHDYQGHRVRAMHAISMAIRQLTHRSMVYSGVGFVPGMNNNAAMGMRRGGVGAGARGAQPMSQAQSDARMSQDLRTLQGINMQLSSQGYNTSGHARARGHVQHAVHELNIALSIR